MMIEANAESFKADTATGLLLVDFYAEWCGPCKSLAPVLEQFEIETNVRVVKVNIDEVDEIPAKFGVRSIPTLVLFKDGEKVSTKVGSQSLTVLKEWVANHS